MERVKRQTSEGALDNVPTRQHILDVALRCFARYSIRLTTMEEVARISGVSRQTVYRHFQGKDELVAAASLVKSKEISAAVQRSTAAAASSRSKIRAAILTCVKWLVTDPQMRELLESDYRALMLRSARPEIVESVTARWAPILDAASADGTLRTNLDRAIVISWLTDIELLLAMRVIALGESLDDTTAEVDLFVLDGLLRR